MFVISFIYELQDLLFSPFSRFICGLNFSKGWSIVDSFWQRDHRRRFLCFPHHIISLTFPNRTSSIIIYFVFLHFFFGFKCWYIISLDTHNVWETICDAGPGMGVDNLFTLFLVNQEYPPHPPPPPIGTSHEGVREFVLCILHIFFWAQVLVYH